MSESAMVSTGRSVRTDRDKSKTDVMLDECRATLNECMGAISELRGRLSMVIPPQKDCQGEKVPANGAGPRPTQCNLHDCLFELNHQARVVLQSLSELHQSIDL